MITTKTWALRNQLDPRLLEDLSSILTYFSPCISPLRRTIVSFSWIGSGVVVLTTDDQSWVRPMSITGTNQQSLCQYAAHERSELQAPSDTGSAWLEIENIRFMDVRLCAALQTILPTASIQISNRVSHIGWHFPDIDVSSVDIDSFFLVSLSETPLSAYSIELIPLFFFCQP